MAKKPKDKIMILDILRKRPGASTQLMASELQTDPDNVWTILNDPDFKAHLCNTKGAHLSHLESLHRIAMERIADCLHEEEDPKKSQDLAKWLLTYSTDSIIKVSELNAENGQVQDGQITINQMMGRDPFEKGGKK
jgi:hypothetical protein